MMKADEAAMQVVKVCRDCGEEYRPEIPRCADCGGELEARYEEEHAGWPRRGSAPPAAPDARPAGDYQPIVWSARASELTPLADRLVELGIPFYLRPRETDAGEGAAGYELRVRHEEREAALREVVALGPVAPLPTAQAPAGGDASGCPACGQRLAPEAVECPDCGLVLGDAPE